MTPPLNSLFNRLIKYNDGKTTAEYTYGADNLRTSKTVNGTKTDFVWNGQNLAGETKNGTETVYTYDQTGIIASKKGTDTAESFFKDPHGDVIAVSKGSNIIGIYDYTAFGNKWIGEPDPFGYCGEYLDSESGLIYLRNRYYDSNTGRFINEDPIKYGLNWYVYCSNNPVIRIDPNGLSDVPAYLDWNDDGVVDTQEDKARFDTDKNGIADWNEYRKYIAPKEWYKYKNSNMLKDFKHVDQEQYEICWAACISMCVQYLTKSPIDMIRIAKDERGENFNGGIGGPIAMGQAIINHGYLDGSGYKVNEEAYDWGDIYKPSNRDKNPLTFDAVVNQIDAGIPIMIRSPLEANHVIVIIGYAYDKNTGKQMILCDNPNGSDLQYIELIDFKMKKRQPGVTFQKIE